MQTKYNFMLMVHGTNQVAVQDANTIWSLLFSLMPSSYWMAWVFSVSNIYARSRYSLAERRTYDKLFHELPGAIVCYSIDYLSISEVKSSIFALNRTMLHELSAKGALSHLKKARVMERFIYLIATEGEDNQNKAERLLLSVGSDTKLIADMIVGRTTIQDAAGRVFKNLSAYGYAFWSGDTRMRIMLENSMDEDVKAKALAECMRIASEGVSYTLNGETITYSKHFDFQPLLDAYQSFQDADTLDDVTHNLDYEAWKNAEKLWLNLGKEQSKVPINVAQEYCSNRRFFPLSSFQNPDSNRTVKLKKWLFLGMGAWEFSQRASNLGVKHAIYKSRADGAIPCEWGALWRNGYAGLMHDDFVAVTALCEQRINHDLSETLESLKPKSPGLQLALF